jgi:flagellar motor component MotA
MEKTLLSSRQELTELILELTKIAKGKGVLSLPEKYHEIDDDFMKYALQSVVDGVDPDSLKAILSEKKTEMIANLSSNLDLFIGSVLAIQLGKEQEVKRLCDE